MRNVALIIIGYCLCFLIQVIRDAVKERLRSEGKDSTFLWLETQGEPNETLENFCVTRPLFKYHSISCPIL